MNLSTFPRCAGYLKGMKVRLDDPGLNEHWASVLLADAFTDDELGDAGVCFEKRDGIDTLTRMETLFRDRLDGARLGELNGWFGAFGVLTKRLRTTADYWDAAKILWPERVTGEGNLRQLHDLISRMSKKSRRSARDNLFKLPARFREKDASQ